MLSELCLFRERLLEDPSSGMPPEGMSSEYISFVLEISENGELCSIHDLRNSQGKPVRQLVPAAVGRTGTRKVSNFLWDNTGYALGVSGKDSPDKVRQKAEAFRSLHRDMLSSCRSAHARALLAFLERWQPEQFKTLDVREALLDSNVAFRLKGEEGCLHEQEDMRQLWLEHLQTGDGKQGVCLVTGKHAIIAQTHPSIKGVSGGQSSGAALVSFNCPAFTSYGKEQSVNAPVSETAARSYTAALNYLLQKEHRQTVRIGDTSIVFWAERATPAESMFGGFWSPEENPQDGKQVALLQSILEALRDGRPLHEADKELDPDVRFFVLGLAPNAARLSVRFWITDTVETLLRHFCRWYEQLDIERQYRSDPKYPPLWRILQSAAAQGKTENIPPELGGQLSRSILTGDRYPENMYLTVLQRIHADKKVDYFRAAYIKAHLCRNHQEKHDMTTLNTDEDNIGYRLGRLFALLEKAQRDALGGNINAPLRERYIGAASATPRMVFPMLLRLAQHHVTKAKKNTFGAYEISFARAVSDIVGTMTDFPAVLSLADQGRFMLGYYHQNNANYQKKNETSDTAD